MRRSCIPLLAVAVAIAPAGACGARAMSVAARLPSKVEARAVCRYVASRGPGVGSRLIKTGVLDANNDGLADSVTIGQRGGTMRGEDLEFRARGAAKDSNPIEVAPKGFQPGDYLPFGARWLAYRGRVYTLYFGAEDLRYASYLGYIDASNAEHLVCDFSHRESEVLRPLRGRVAGGLCRMVAQRRTGYVPVVEDGDTALALDRWATRVAGRVAVDFANRGAPAQLALLAYESGAGRGCRFGYFDLIADGKVADTGEAHALLMKLQGVEPSADHTSGSCDDGTPRWFEDGGSTYLDMGRGAARSGPPFHEVRLVRGGRIETLCKASFSVRWSVQSMGAEFK